MFSDNGDDVCNTGEAVKEVECQEHNVYQDTSRVRETTRCYATQVNKRASMATRNGCTFRVLTVRTWSMTILSYWELYHLWKISLRFVGIPEGIVSYFQAMLL